MAGLHVRFLTYLKGVRVKAIQVIVIIICLSYKFQFTLIKYYENGGRATIKSFDFVWLQMYDFFCVQNN